MANCRVVSSTIMLTVAVPVAMVAPPVGLLSWTRKAHIARGLDVLLGGQQDHLRRLARREGDRAGLGIVVGSGQWRCRPPSRNSRSRASNWPRTGSPSTPRS